MATLSCISSSLTVTNSFAQFQHKLTPSTVSFSSLQRRARNQSSFNKPAVLPLSPVLDSSRTSSVTTKAAPSSTPPADTTAKKSKETVEHIVEHIVLFKMKPGFTYKDDQTNEEAYDVLIDAMNSLKTLPGVLYLSSGRIKAAHSSLHEDFTVFLHSRHATSADLDLYMGHRLKYAFSMTYTESTYEDYMIIDYVHSHSHDSPLDHPDVGQALRTTFFKLQDGYEENDKETVRKVVDEEHLPKSVGHITFGDSFVGTTYRKAHKGYQLGSLALFKDLPTLESLPHTPEQYAHHLARKLKGILVPEGGVIVVDYEVKEVYNGNRDTLLPLKE